MWSLPRMAVATVVVLVLAGCGEEAERAADETEQEAEQQGTDEAESTQDEVHAAGDAHLAVDSTELGEILVDTEGMTLYLFTNDPEGASVCEDDCAAAWPPLVVEGEPAAGEGVDEALVGTTERADGSTQVTYAGAPLYTWAQDEQPGDVTGQGVQDVWFVVAPDGEAIMDADDEQARDEGY
jgi:predicted lipoprotein with Yx(FWY)xxD motif